MESALPHTKTSPSIYLRLGQWTRHRARFVAAAALALCGYALPAHAQMNSICAPRTIDSTNWVYSGGDFSGWLATNPAISSGMIVATRTFNSDSGSPDLVCSILTNGTGAAIASNSVAITITGNLSGNYYTLPGFTGIGFKINVRYHNQPSVTFSNNPQSLRGPHAPNTSILVPGGAVSNIANFGACETEGTGGGGTSCSYSGGGATGNGSYYRLPEYFHKTWIYELIAYRLTSNPVAGTFLISPNFLPQVKVKGTWNYYYGAGQIATSADLYCIGCTASGGTPPTVTNPATCSISSALQNQTVTMNPATVTWNDFTLTADTTKVNTAWTPFKIQLGCDYATVAARFYASDATVASANANASGRLINSSNTSGNVGVQVFYKSNTDATCTTSGANLASGTAVSLNKTNPVRVTSLASTSTAPYQNFCARYYTTAATESALSIGAVTATMSYTFEYE